MEKPILRSRSIGTKVSDEEYAQLERLAQDWRIWAAGRPG
jgi:hypothetical protein